MSPLGLGATSVNAESTLSAQDFSSLFRVTLKFEVLTGCTVSGRLEVGGGFCPGHPLSWSYPLECPCAHAFFSRRPAMSQRHVGGFLQALSQLLRGQGSSVTVPGPVCLNNAHSKQPWHTWTRKQPLHSQQPPHWPLSSRQTLSILGSWRKSLGAFLIPQVVLYTFPAVHPL